MGRQLGKSKAFTLVEVLVIITIIGILAGIFIVSLARYQAEARDARRAAQVTVISEALEKYYDENGEYPSCRSVIQTPVQVSANVLKGTDATIYTAPLDETGLNSLLCDDLSSTSDDNFGYVGDGSSTCSDLLTGQSCVSYTLQYREEITGQIVSIESRRNTKLSTSGTITDLTATTSGFDRVSLSWSAIPNAASYTVHYSSNGFSTYTTISPNPTTNSYVVTGLGDGTNYSFRVIPNASSGAGAISNVATATTWSLTNPSIVIGASTNTSIQFSWNAITHADDYRYQLSTVSNFSTLVADTTTSGTSVTRTGLTTGERYYIRVQSRAVNGTYTSGWSTANTVTDLPTPTGVAVVTLSPTSYRESWNAVSAPGVTYTAQCSTNNTSWGTSCEETDIATTNYTFTGADQGKTYYTRVRAVTADTNSDWSSSVSTTTSINAPGSYTMSSSNNGVTLSATANATCGAGAVREYAWYANGSFWVQGTQYQSVGYTVNPGSSVTLTVMTRCNGANLSSGWTWASNNASFSRPGLSLSMSAGSDGCGGSFCGRQVNANWNNFCGGSGSIYATQYSYSDSWSVSGGSHSTRWKGASSPGAPVTYNLSLCSTSASATLYVISAYKCQGCS